MKWILRQWGNKIFYIKKREEFYYQIFFLDGSEVNLVDFSHFTHKKKGINNTGKDFEFFYNSIIGHKDKEKFINKLYKEGEKDDI